MAKLYIPTSAIYAVRRTGGAGWKKVTPSKAAEIVEASDPRALGREDGIELLVALPQAYAKSWSADAKRGLGLVLWDHIRGTLPCDAVASQLRWVDDERFGRLGRRRKLSRGAKAFDQLRTMVCKPAKQSNRGCPTGDIRRKGYTRKGYTKADGTRVAATKVPSTCITDRGRPGRGKKVVPKLKEGSLGGPGYTEKSQAARRTILRDCIRKSGYRDCLGKLGYLLLVGGSTWPKQKLDVVKADKKWLTKTYGGPGSFGPQRKSNPEVRSLVGRLMR